MRTDNLFYRLFQRAPELAFELLGLSPPAAPYQFQSVELKEFGFRLDGLLLPTTPDPALPFILIEAQMQPDARFYYRLQNELATYLLQYQPVHPWRVLVLYPNRRTERVIPNLPAYLTYWQVQRVYLDELPANQSLAMELLRLIAAPVAEAVAIGRAILQQEPEPWLEWVVEALVRKRRRLMEMLGLVPLQQTQFYREVYQEGETALVLRQLQRKVGFLSLEQVQQIEALSLEQLENLGEALLDFQSVSDLENWLAQNPAIAPTEDDLATNSG
ncbi:MAG: DUF2887 domain-containing protein [Gloeomargarita sp. SKYBB_i_bin120]|nr:DUF2887 domain-containing protein [Gloeomargarita sp. SKYB120]MDW8178391.1 DUF2887 domain-containing protein [Gloeomargarita sp. SKYBB_i_bin120]